MPLQVLQRLGKSEETKDEHFEQCVMNLQFQQVNYIYMIPKVTALKIKSWLNFSLWFPLQSDGYRIYKDLKAYLNAVTGWLFTVRLVQEIRLNRNTDMLYCAWCLTVMKDASGRLFQSLFDAYDDKWDGAEDLGEVVEVSLRDHTVRKKTL